MSKIQRFEDLIAWQKARELTKEIYIITRQGDFAKDYVITFRTSLTQKYHDIVNLNVCVCHDIANSLKI